MLARKEAEFLEKEEQLKRKEEEEAKLRAQVQAEREAREAAEEAAKREEAEREAQNEMEKRTKEEEALKRKASAERREREEAEERLKEEQRAREEEEALEEEEAREIARIAMEVAGSRTSLEGAAKDEDSIQYQEDAEDEDESERFAQLEADIQEEAERRADEEKDTDTLAESNTPSNDTVAYKEDESEAPSPEEPVERFIRQPRTLVKKSDILVKYDIGDKIGDGNFADVHEATNKETSELFAMKIIVKAKLKNKEHMVENEIAIMKSVQHKNIVRLYEEFETRGHIYLVMEYVTGGDLFDAITESTKFTEEDAALMVADLSSALAYLHNLNVVHRDLKPENLLVSFDCG